MAETERRRIIANRGRRRLTAKQIRFFGTPAQKAALKASRRRNRSAGTRKRHKIHRRARRAAVKRNAGEIVGYTLANTGAKRKRRKTATKGNQAMAKPKRARRRSAGSGTRKQHRRRRYATRRNTGHRTHRRRSVMRHHRRYRRNIGMGAGLGPLVTKSAFALAGAAASKIIPQVLLGTTNTGWIGYLANAGTGFALWLLAEKVLKNRNAAEGIAIGTAVQILDRILNDMTPFGTYLAGAGFGDYQAQAYLTPQVLVDPYNSARIRMPAGMIPPPAPTSPSKAAAAVGVGAYGGGTLYGGGSSLY